MRQTFLAAAGALLVGSAAGAQQQLTLQQAVEMAQKQGYQARAAVATRDAARAHDHAFGARLLPQLSLAGNAPVYEKFISAVIQPDGSTNFTPVQQTTANASMTIAQKLPFTGGTFSITSALQRYEQNFAGQQTMTWTSSPVTFRLEQPVLRPNAIRWDNREQDIRLDLSERQYLEAREGIALQTTNAFFDFYIAKKTLDNATANAAVNDTLYTLNKGRLEVGKIGENDLLQSELALLRSRSALENARLEYERSLAAFRLALNLAPGTPLDVSVPAGIPQLRPDTTIAVTQALKNRAQLSDLELQSVQARRRVAEAKLTNGPGATLVASVGFNQTAPDVNLAYQDLLQAQRFSLGVNVPLFQWGARGADIQAALADQKRVDATSRASREQIAQDAHFGALQLTQATRNVALSAKADTVAQKRFEVAYNRYVIGRIGIDNLYIAQNEKDQAVNQYLQALRNYWTAYYRLRQTTLFDFESGSAIR
jgi:outer membrane protein TolC